MSASPAAGYELTTARSIWTMIRNGMRLPAAWSTVPTRCTSSSGQVNSQEPVTPAWPVNVSGLGSGPTSRLTRNTHVPISNPGDILLQANSFYHRPAEHSGPALQLTYDDRAGRFPWEQDYDSPGLQPRPGSFTAWGPSDD